MTARLKAKQDFELHAVSLKTGDVFAARARDAQRLVTAGQAEAVNAKGETSREAKRSARTSKNAARKRK